MADKYIPWEDVKIGMEVLYVGPGGDSGFIGMVSGKNESNGFTNLQRSLNSTVEILTIYDARNHLYPPDSSLDDVDTQWLKQGTKVYQREYEYELHAIKMNGDVVEYLTLYDDSIGGRVQTTSPWLYTFRPVGKSSIKIIEPEKDDHEGMIQGYDGKWRWF